MIVNFYYSHVDKSVNDMMIVYRRMAERLDFYKNSGVEVSLINVTTVSLEELSRLSSLADVNIVDATVRNIVTHEFGKVPDNTVIRQSQSKEHYVSAYEILVNSDACKILLTQALDLHWHCLDLQSLARFDGFYWIYEKEPVNPLEVPVAYRETWFSQHSNPMDVWKDITAVVKSRAEICFSVMPDRSIGRKFYDYVIAGCYYQTRMLASLSLKDENLSQAPFRHVERVASIFPGYLKKMGLSKDWINERYIALRMANYHWNIRHSRTAFACGSGLNYPVRKFFQIPSYGALMLAYPCTGFRDYGFVDGVNCLETAPEDAGKVARNVINNPVLLEKITRAGWEYVQREHNVDNRIAQILRCTEEIWRGRKINAQYRAGKFEIADI